jgi:hypothetical protein
LNKNTAELNKFIYAEQDRVNEAVTAIVDGSENVGSEYPSNFDSLLDSGAIYNQDDKFKALGLKRPTTVGATPFQNQYPDLSDRLKLNPFITQAETQFFIRQNLFVPDTFTSSLRPGNVAILRALNTFYGRGNFSKSSIGAFCALVPDIFAAFNTAKDIFADIRNFSEEALNFLSQPIGFDFKLSEGAVKALLSQLENQLLTVVDQLAQQALDKIRNITNGWIDPEYMFNHGALSEKFIREKEKAMNFLSKENIEAIKERLRGAMKYAAGVFERMDLEEIQFLILRFCELISQIEQIFFGRSQVLTEYQSAYSFARTALTNSSNIATSRAIQAGAIRYNPETRYNIQTRTAQLGASGPISSSPWAPPGSLVPAEARGVPVNIDPISPEELAQVPSFEEIMAGHPRLFFTAGLGGMGAAGWSSCQPTEKVMLLRLAKVYGQRLGINSAYRSPSYNAAVGGSPNSVHMSGKAFDISSTSSGFINMARSIGFCGFGTYRSFTHIDTGLPRTWSG